MSGILILGAVIASGVLSTCLGNLFGKKILDMILFGQKLTLEQISGSW